MEDKSNCEVFALKKGTVQKQSKVSESNLVPKKILVIVQFEPKFLCHANFDWGRCSIHRISVVYMYDMYLCSMQENEIETPKESVERDHSLSAYHIIYAYRLLTAATPKKRGRKKGTKNPPGAQKPGPKPKKKRKATSSPNNSDLCEGCPKKPKC